MSAIFFGSISTIADTSELQRQAFNQAFAQHNLDWQWSRELYVELLEKNGGQERIHDYALSLGQAVDAEEVHRSKSELFQKSLAETQLTARPGVTETIKLAKQHDCKIALVTTTSSQNVSAILEALRTNISSGDLDLVVSASDIENPKPAKDAYIFALKALNQTPQSCVAIEDNLGGVEAAKAAAIPCVAFPNENTAGHDFSAADLRSDQLSFDQLQKFL